MTNSHDILATEQKETDRTEQTDVRDLLKVTNSEFLAAIYRDIPEAARLFTVSFTGHPKEGKWSGQAISLRDSVSLPKDTNAYFSLAIFWPDKSGKYVRQKKYHAASYCFILDDVGSKIDPSKIKLKPSWIIETSPGNYQYGYIFQVSVTDPTALDLLFKKLKEKGLTDPGAGGFATRLARLPVAINGKYNPPFMTKLIAFEPDQRYSFKDLMHGLGLDEDSQPANSIASKKSRKADSDDSEQLFIAKAAENPVVTALKARSIYKSEEDSGRHGLTCPWVHEHTDQADSGTVYFEPGKDFPRGGFKCHHGHCADRNLYDLLDHLGISPSVAQHRPVIRTQAGKIPEMADAAERLMAETGKFYQRGGIIVCIYMDSFSREYVIREIKQSALQGELSMLAIWERYDARQKELVATDPPDKVIAYTANKGEYQHLRPLNGIAYQPYLRLDGNLMNQTGYDPQAGLYASFDPENFCIPKRPDKQSAEKALNFILGLLQEFLFESEYDRSAAVCAILTAAMRLILPQAPMFHVRAHQISSGKSFLCQMISLAATPKPNAPHTFPRDATEFAKIILAELMLAPSVIEFDNMITDIFPHKTLCTMITSEFITGRVLGHSKTATVGTRALLLSSGNNVGPVGDMTRRCITINLNPNCEMPAERSFKRPNLIREIKAQRGMYVSAALTIIYAWLHASKPMTECKPLASFGEWSDFCRQPLLWLGLPDPAHSVYMAMSTDPDKELLRRLLHIWHQLFGSKPTRIREIMALYAPTDFQANGDEIELAEVLREIAGDLRGDINRRMLGHFLKRNLGVMVDGLRLQRGNSGRYSSESWRVEQIGATNG